MTPYPAKRVSRAETDRGRCIQGDEHFEPAQFGYALCSGS